MIGTKMVIAAGGFALITGAGLVASMAPDDYPTPVAAAYAAECAGFPAHIVSAITKYYKREGEVDLAGLPPTYQVTNVHIQMAAGTCLTEPGSVSPGASIHLQNAVAFVDQADVAPGALPFYVIGYVGGTRANATYVAMRLPRPEISLAPERPPARIA